MYLYFTYIISYVFTRREIEPSRCSEFETLLAEPEEPVELEFTPEAEEKSAN